MHGNCEPRVVSFTFEFVQGKLSSISAGKYVEDYTNNSSAPRKLVTAHNEKVGNLGRAKGDSYAVMRCSSPNFGCNPEGR